MELGSWILGLKWEEGVGAGVGARIWSSEMQARSWS